MNWDNFTKGWKNTFDFTGRASRTEFWLLVLSGIVIYFIALMITIVIPVFGAVVYLIFIPAFIIASLSVTVRRTRDTGASGWFGVLAFLTGIFALIVGFIPSKASEHIDVSSSTKQKASPEIKDFHYTPERKAQSNQDTEQSSRPAAARLPLKDFN
jgi:uncharacterized membrane protein YhaH (DUF805 family)